MELATIPHTDPRYPASVVQFFGTRAPASLSAYGNLDLLKVATVALFCSRQCPGNLILRTYDLAQALRDAQVPVISGFHTPMEKECLRILLRGNLPVIYCLARNLSPRLFTEYREPLERGHLVLLSPFDSKQKRITGVSSQARNRVVAALASTVLVAYAAPRSNTEQLCGELIAQNKPVCTFGDLANARLLEMGAIGFEDDLRMISYLREKVVIERDTVPAMPALSASADSA